MKKTIIAPGLFRDFGGPRKTIGTFAEALGAEVHCFADCRRIERERLAVEQGRPVHTSGLPLLRQFLVPSTVSRNNIEREVASSGLISCHMFYRYYAIWVNQMYRKYGVPYWFVPHGILDPWVMTSGRIVKSLYWKFGGERFLREAKTVICATQAERDKAAAHFDLPDVDVLPWPVEVVDISRRDERRSRIREGLSIPSNAHVLLYFGRLHPMKQPVETIHALAESKTEDTHLIVVGNEDGVSLRECRDVADFYGMRERVHVIGPVYGEEKYDYLMASDAYISLSHRENFNHTAAESLAAGLSVILSPGNDLLSEIADVPCYFEMESNLAGDAAHAIKSFAEKSTDELAEMGQRGRKWVKEFLNFQRFSERLDELAIRHAVNG